jgi:hypothetical protein
MYILAAVSSVTILQFSWVRLRIFPLISFHYAVPLRPQFASPCLILHDKNKPYGEADKWLQTFLTSAIYGDERLDSRPGRLIPWVEDRDTH